MLRETDGSRDHFCVQKIYGSVQMTSLFSTLGKQNAFYEVVNLVLSISNLIVGLNA